MRYLWLALAFLVGIASVLLGSFLGLSRDVTTTTAMALTFLMLFPFVKQFAPKLRFSVWVIAAVISTVVAWLLSLGFSRFGG